MTRLNLLEPMHFKTLKKLLDNFSDNEDPRFLSSIIAHITSWPLCSISMAKNDIHRMNDLIALKHNSTRNKI